jgi:hypothetical protein
MIGSRLVGGSVGPPGPAGADGIDGTDGTDGTDGADGAGVATGGTAGQMLTKVDGVDFNTAWVTALGEIRTFTITSDSIGSTSNQDINLGVLHPTFPSPRGVVIAASVVRTVGSSTGCMVAIFNGDPANGSAPAVIFGANTTTGINAASIVYGPQSGSTNAGINQVVPYQTPSGARLRIRNSGTGASTWQVVLTVAGY